MKRIVAAISALLAVCLVFGGCSAADRLSSGAYTEGPAAITDEIYKIDIEWPRGNVMVIGNKKAKEITVKENDSAGVALATRIIGSVLYIKPAKPGKEAGEKSLRVIVPSDYNFKEIEIRTKTANAGLRMLKASRADIETDSGSISVVACVIDDEAELESVTGGITVIGEVEDYDISSVSGNVSITSGFIPQDIDIETVDGIITAQLPADTPAGSLKTSTGGKTVNRLTNKEKGENYSFKSETGNIFVLENIKAE